VDTHYRNSTKRSTSWQNLSIVVDINSKAEIVYDFSGDLFDQFFMRSESDYFPDFKILGGFA